MTTYELLDILRKVHPKDKDKEITLATSGSGSLRELGVDYYPGNDNPVFFWSRIPKKQG